MAGDGEQPSALGGQELGCWLWGALCLEKPLQEGSGRQAAVSRGTGWEAAACMGRPAALGLHWTPLGLHPHPFPPACLLWHPGGSKVRGGKAISPGLAGEQLSGLPASVSRASDLKGSPGSP